MTFNANNNRITSAGFAYDAAGNLTDDGPHTYTFDAESKISKVDAVSAYVYDGEGQRVRKLVGENLRFIYDMGGRQIAEFDGSTGALKKEYVYGAGGLVATVEPTAVNSNGTRYTTSDHLGSPRVVTNSSAAVVSRHDYMPFGEELFTGGRTTAMGYGVADGQRQQFTSKERDNETGLDYFGARYYGSSHGRFTSPDPLLTSATVESPQSWNRYDYTLNNPLKYIDPTGMWNWDASAGGSATDQALWDKAHDKSLKKKERNEAQRQYNFRKKFEAGLDAVGTAANSSSLTANQQGQVREVHDSYGTVNDNNGVLVGINKSGNPGTQLNDDGTITVNFRDNDKGKSFATTVAHEGQHVEDAQAFLAHPYVFSTWDLTHYEREMKAYDTGAYTAQALGMKSYPSHSDLQAWQSGWKEAERVTRIANYVRAGYPSNPGPEKPGARYSEEYKGFVRWVP